MQSEEVAAGPGQGAAASEDGRDNTADHALAEDPISMLLADLAAAADTGDDMALGRRARVRVRRVPTGFAIERGRSE